MARSDGGGPLVWGGFVRRPQHQRFNEACERGLRYVPVEGGEVVRVYGVKATRQALAVVRTPEGFDTRLVDLGGG
jgi:hypothetical protein